MLPRFSRHSQFRVAGWVFPSRFGPKETPSPSIADPHPAERFRNAANATPAVLLQQCLACIRDHDHERQPL